MTQQATQTLEYSAVSSPEGEENKWARLCPTSGTPSNYSIIELTKDETWFGRDDSNDISIPSPTISLLHAIIIRNKDRNHHHNSSTGHLATIHDYSSNGTFINNTRIGQDNERMIFDGDIITFQQHKANHPEISFTLHLHSNMDSTHSIMTKYDLQKVLGSGAFGTVQLGIDRKSGDQYAIKMIDKRKFEMKNGKKGSIMEEVRIMFNIEHENIIKIYDVFDETDSLYIVLELANGGDLSDRIAHPKRLKEDIARNVTRQLLSAIMYLHEQNIAHRDLKVFSVVSVHSYFL